jgi:hypothetical protein
MPARKRKTPRLVYRWLIWRDSSSGRESVNLLTFGYQCDLVIPVLKSPSLGSSSREWIGAVPLLDLCARIHSIRTSAQLTYASGASHQMDGRNSRHRRF